MSDKNHQKKIVVIHGPNLNMLGKREPKIYGFKTLSQIDEDIHKAGDRLDIKIETYQSNHEGEIVEKIHKIKDYADGLIINPAGYTHTSVAIRDALLLLDCPIVEVHISNIYKREPFRKVSLISDIALGSICGFGHYGYILALEGISDIIKLVM